MFSLSRLGMLVVAFFLGFASCLGVIVGAGYYALNSVTINQIEEKTGVDLQTEKVLGENPEVDLRDMSVIGMTKEFGELKTLDADLTINTLVSRYDLILHDKIDKLLSKEVRDVPISKLLTDEGKDALFSTLYIGQIQGFECLNPDGTAGSPLDEDTYWYNPATETVITGLNDLLADFTLADILGGGLSTDTLLGEIHLADILGYTYDEENEYWKDTTGTQVTGVMAVFAECTVLTVDEKLNTVKIGDLLVYSYNEDEGVWYEGADKVHGFMNVVAGRTLDNVGSIMDDLTIGDIIPEREGIIAIIPADTKFNDIGDTINDSIKKSPLQFFMNQGLVVFEDATKLDNLAITLGKISTFTAVSEGEAGYEEYKQNYDYYNTVWTDNGDGTYSVPTWRTKPMAESFSYIVSMIMP